MSNKFLIDRNDWLAEAQNLAYISDQTGAAVDDVLTVDSIVGGKPVYKPKAGQGEFQTVTISPTQPDPDGKWFVFGLGDKQQAPTVTFQRVGSIVTVRIASMIFLTPGAAGAVQAISPGTVSALIPAPYRPKDYTGTFVTAGSCLVAQGLTTLDGLKPGSCEVYSNSAIQIKPLESGQYSEFPIADNVTTHPICISYEADV